MRRFTPLDGREKGLFRIRGNLHVLDELSVQAPVVTS